VRELRNLVERLVIMAPGPRVGRDQVAGVLPHLARGGAIPTRLSEAMRAYERTRIEAAVAAADGNMTEAAERLGLERSHLYKKLKRLRGRAAG